MPLRLGVLGCGRVFERFHLPAIDHTPSTTLVGAADVEAARLAWAASRSPRPALGRSLEELLAQTDLDALLILTTPTAHAGLAVQALEAGLHVLVEKPMALTVTEGRRMTDVARSRGRLLQVGHTRRFREPYGWLRARLRDPAAPRPLQAHFELTFPIVGWNAYSGFLGDGTRGGAPLDDVLSHQVDLLCWCFEAKPDAARAEIGAGGAVRAEFRFEKVTATCHASHGGYAERLEMCMADRRTLEATGTRVRFGAGSSFPGWRRQRAMLLDRLTLAGNKLRRRPKISNTSFELQLQDFVQAIGGGTPAGATAAEGVRVLEVLDACRRSAEQRGVWIPVD